MSLLSIVTCAVPDGKVPACGDAAGGGDEHAPIPTTISPDPSPAANRFDKPTSVHLGTCVTSVLRNVASCRPGRWLIAALVGNWAKKRYLRPHFRACAQRACPEEESRMCSSGGSLRSLRRRGWRRLRSSLVHA